MATVCCRHPSPSPGTVEMGSGDAGGMESRKLLRRVRLHCQGTERLAAGSGKQSARCCVGIKGGGSALGRCRLKSCKVDKGDHVGPLLNNAGNALEPGSELAFATCYSGVTNSKPSVAGEGLSLRTARELWLVLGTLDLPHWI